MNLSVRTVVLFFITSFFICELANAQCPVDVQITASHPNPVCKNTTVTYTANPTNGGANPEYIWMVSGDTVSESATYSVNFNDLYVEVYLISSNGCPQDTAMGFYNLVTIDNVVEYEVVVEECNQPVADINITSVSVDEEPYTYNLYVGGSGLGQQTTYEDLTVSSYPLVIEYGSGCVDTTWIDMATVTCPEPLPIEAFTPNEDGFNDKWFIQNIEFYPNNEVFIYDRWGQRVYHKEGYTNQDAWDAKYIGTNMPVSTYYYILKINYQKQDEKVYNGPISIFR